MVCILWIKGVLHSIRVLRSGATRACRRASQTICRNKIKILLNILFSVFSQGRRQPVDGRRFRDLLAQRQCPGVCVCACVRVQGGEREGGGKEDGEGGWGGSE